MQAACTTLCFSSSCAVLLLLLQEVLQAPNQRMLKWIIWGPAKWILACGISH